MAPTDPSRGTHGRAANQRSSRSRAGPDRPRRPRGDRRPDHRLRHACPRCGWRWGGQAAVAGRQGIALTFADLLRLTGCVDVGQLEERIGDYADLGTFLDFDDHPDPNTGFVVGVSTLGTELTFPLPIHELWEAVDRMEDQVREMWELEEQSDARQPDLPVPDHQVEPSIAGE